MAWMIVCVKSHHHVQWGLAIRPWGTRHNQTKARSSDNQWCVVIRWVCKIQTAFRLSKRDANSIRSSSVFILEHTMQQYIKNAFISRGLDPDFDPPPLCEVCAAEWVYHRAWDVDHIDGRGGKHNTDNRMLDPYNLIFVCRKRHTNKSSQDRIRWREIARECIDGKQKTSSTSDPSYLDDTEWGTVSTLQNGKRVFIS